MSSELAVLIASSAVAIVAVVLVLAPEPTGRAERPADRRRDRRSVGVAFGAALIVLAMTGWVAPAVVAGIAAALASRAWNRRDRRRLGDVDRIDGLASWIENLRDVLVAGDQPVGAIGATVATCPAAIRPQVRRLAAGLGRQPPDVVLTRFADDIDDPLGDLVAAGLLIAIERGARTSAVLTSLADQARHQADRRRLVEAERAPVQREVTMLTAIMAALVVGLFVFARSAYLAPYATAGGQLFLGAVLGVYLVLLARVHHLAGYPRPSRFLVRSGAGR